MELSSKEIGAALVTLILAFAAWLTAHLRALAKQKEKQIAEHDDAHDLANLRNAYSELSIARAEIARLIERLNTCENALQAFERLYQDSEDRRIEAELKADRFRAENDRLRQRIEELERTDDVEQTSSGDITDKMQAAPRKP